MGILDPGWKKFGSGIEKIWIRDEHPGSATLVREETEGSIREAITRLNLTLTALQLELVDLILGLQPRLLLGNLLQNKYHVKPTRLASLLVKRI